MAKGAYKTDKYGDFLLSIIRHSDLKVVNYEAVGKEHGITGHSAYCRFNGIKNSLKAESQVGTTTSENAENNSPAQVSPSKKRGRKPASPSKPKGKKAKEEPIAAAGSNSSGANDAEENVFDEDDEEQLLSSPNNWVE
ncbi:uncharacterized protein DFL_002636 [Arthrobotrys flagrans]|uniref:Myb-like DNA-binding domain-containing protein n=1 Tax=Arthrobotrys flagrans TaxID=97331 RepID=A0A437ABD2_ARTFL|nr:hypothetical protein DFL_002636 [Arthrobotrys flagrans]